MADRPKDEAPEPSAGTDRLGGAYPYLHRLYGGNDQFDGFISAVAERISRAKAARPEALKQLDQQRIGQPAWFNRAGRPAYSCYIDRFAGTLGGTIARIPYLKDLGVGLFHPLPLLRPREGDNDGGFAVADYKDVDPKLGTFSDLEALATALRENDISLVLDIVCNHTAREHPWAQAWRAGDPEYRDFYIRFDTDDEMQAWQAPLTDVFPDTAPGSFTYDAEAGGYVWTTFYPFQWDLNYANPRVFLAMLDVLLDLANAGVEGFRLDSAAYLWKERGTNCRNLPQAHDILKAFRHLLAEAMPGVFLLAEAIEGMDEVLGYFGPHRASSECDLAYNNTPMTAVWAALSEQRADILAEAISRSAAKPAHGTWLNYARCHDDIIWQALSSWVDPSRLWAWSDFYAGKAGSYARGRPFQAPPGLAPSTCGMAASLCGGNGPAAIDRLKMVYSLIYALDGVPMIYMGDEIALLNDETFDADPEKTAEIRWLHRPLMDWTAANRRHQPGTPWAGMFAHIQKMNAVLRSIEGWKAAAPATAPDSGFPALLRLERQLNSGLFRCLANLGSRPLELPEAFCGKDLLSGQHVSVLAPAQVGWTLN